MLDRIARLFQKGSSGLRELVDLSADLLEVGRSREARELCLKAIEIDPKCAPAWSNLAFAALQLGEFAAAASAAQKAIEIAPMNATAWHNLGEAHWRMGEASNALTYNNRALSIDSSSPQYWLGRGNALMALERYPESLPCLDRALALDPSNRPAKLNRDVAWLRADARRNSFFLCMLGISASLDDRQRIPEFTAVNLAALAQSEPQILDREFLLAFDSFLQICIASGHPSVVSSCLTGLLVSRLLKDANLEKRMSERFEEATSRHGVR